jgi:hypothetical protein
VIEARLAFAPGTVGEKKADRPPVLDPVMKQGFVPGMSGYKGAWTCELMEHLSFLR